MRIAAALLVSSVFLCGTASYGQEPAKVEVGKTAPDFTATGIDSKKFKLSDRIGKDKNIILMFSRASW